MKLIDFKTCVRMGFNTAKQVLFIRAPNSKTFRVYALHSSYELGGKLQAITELLDESCSYKYGVVWIFYPDKTSEIEWLLQHFAEVLKVAAYVCEPPADFGNDEHNKPIPETLN